MVCSIPRYFELLEYNGGGALGMEIDGILDRGMIPMHRSDTRIVNVSKKELDVHRAYESLIKLGIHSSHKFRLTAFVSH